MMLLPKHWPSHCSETLFCSQLYLSMCAMPAPDQNQICFLYCSHIAVKFDIVFAFAWLYSNWSCNAFCTRLSAKCRVVLHNRHSFLAGDVFEDVERIWHNCHSFNEPESEICTTASEAQQAFHARWQQQGLLQHEVKPDKTKSGRSSKQAAPAAEAAAGKGGKKQSGAKGKPEAATAAASGKGKVAADDRGHKAQPGEKSASAPSSKQKRGSESVANAKAAASSAQKSETKQLAPEKLSASARLRKGLPPTPPIRISPRGAASEAVATSKAEPNAAATSEAEPNAAATAAAKGKGKTKPSAKVSIASAGNAQVKPGTDEPVLRRTSGRLK